MLSTARAFVLSCSRLRREGGCAVGTAVERAAFWGCGTPAG
jgi:hypothetical protein